MPLVSPFYISRNFGRGRSRYLQVVRLIVVKMASTSHSRSLLERISSEPSDPWAYDHYAAEETFQPRPRRPKRKQEPEIDSEYIYTPWIDGMKVTGDESKNQR
jgi:hypothetical protein